MSSVDITGAPEEKAGFTNIETSRIRAATIDEAVEDGVVTGVPFEKPTLAPCALLLRQAVMSRRTLVGKEEGSFA